jgi:hypothetical protein
MAEAPLNIIKCSHSLCSNYVVDSYSEYGCYCFKHSSLTQRPTFDSPSTSVESNSTVGFDLYSRMESLSSAVSSKRGECCLCHKSMSLNKQLRCKHLVCRECLLANVKTMECPVCLQRLSGPLITSQVVISIELKSEEKIPSFSSLPRF